jgi:hypothetical protein
LTQRLEAKQEEESKKKAEPSMAETLNTMLVMKMMKKLTEEESSGRTRGVSFDDS